jgi:hypothetical protein
MAEGRYLLVDRRAGRAFMVSEAGRAVLELPAGGAAAPGGGPRPYSPDARFAREGSDRVAGTPCTVWRIEDQGVRVRACITADGVLLRARDMGGPGGDAAGADREAVRVDYGGQDPARFRPPPGFQTMRMPGQMMPPGGGPPGMQGGGPGRPPPR